MPVTRDLLPDLEERRPDPEPAWQPGEEEAPQVDPEELRQQVIEEARQEAERLMGQARAEGYRQGIEEGRAAFAERVEGVVVAF